MFLIQQCQMSSGPHGPIFMVLRFEGCGNEDVEHIDFRQLWLGS